MTPPNIMKITPLQQYNAPTTTKIKISDPPRQLNPPPPPKQEGGGACHAYFGRVSKASDEYK